MGSERSTVADIAEEIARYLADHPDAADTVEGIRRWWLLGQRPEHAATQVQHALDWLVHRGLVVKRVLRDGQVVYAKAGDKPLPQTMH
jgi:Fe2+ or Zn2+ uptake regulation protein